MTDSPSPSDTKNPTLTEGDIYRWRWADPKLDADSGPYRSYHCCSQLAVVRSGRLMDTFWFGSDNKVLDPSAVTLEFLGNTADLVGIRPCDVAYYRSDDIVDMRHSNNSHGPIYRRKDAERDQATMLELIERRLQECHHDIQFAEQRIRQLSSDAEKVRSGRLKEVYL